MVSGTEHERIVNALHRNDLVFDVFAGVGPFVVPASMLGCTVYANDLNPECFKWMNVNLRKNQPKTSPSPYHVFNLDGRQFLRTIVLPNIATYQPAAMIDVDNAPALPKSRIVILMNLPELALSFLDVFSQWLTVKTEEKQQWRMPIHIYCYTFSRELDRDEDVRTRLYSIVPLIRPDQISCRWVRQVAPKKDMMCVHINLDDDVHA